MTIIVVLGDHRDTEILSWIQRRFSRIGFQSIETDNHTLVLSFPNSTLDQSFRSKVNYEPFKMDLKVLKYDKVYFFRLN